MSDQAIASIVLFALQLAQFGLERDAIVSDVRQKEAEGMTPAEISAYLKALADAKLAEVNAVQG